MSPPKPHTPDHIWKTYQALCSRCKHVRFHSLRVHSGARCLRLTIGGITDEQAFIGDYHAPVGAAFEDRAMAHFLADPQCRDRLLRKLGPDGLAEVEEALKLDQAANAEREHAAALNRRIEEVLAKLRS